MKTTRHRAGRGRLVRGIGWMAVAGMLGLALVGPGAGGVAAVSYATVTGHSDFVAGDPNSNSPDFWGPNCTKTDGAPGSADGGSTIVLTQSYGKVVVKSGSGIFQNTIFGASPSAGQSVWADTNGNNIFDPGGNGFDQQISHVIWCDPVQTTTTSTTTTDTTTTDTTTTDTTTTDTTTTDTTTTDTTTTDTTTTDTTTTDTTSTTTTDTTTTTSTTTTATTVTTFTTTEPTEPPFPSFPTNPPTTPPTNPPTQPPTEPPTVAPTDTGGVAGVTSAPNTTPPPTSTGGTTGTPNDGTWRIALIAMAGLLATVLVMTPATARRRR